MHINVCKLFCDLIETESFSQTGERHGVSQSAVSQKIRTLEKHLNVPLVERGRHCIGLTREGAVFLDSARKMLSIYQSMQQKIEALQQEVSGSLEIATVLSIGVHELPLYVKRYREDYPDVDLRVEYRRSSQVYADVIDGRTDLGLVAYPQRRKGVVIHSFWRDRLVVICAPSHPLADRYAVTVKDLAKLPMVGFEPDLPSRQALDKAFSRAGVKMNQVLDLDNVDTVKKAVELGSGFAIVPLRTVHHDIEMGRLRGVMFNDRNCWRPLGILGKRNRVMTPVMREFVRILTNGRHVPEATTSSLA